MANATVYETGGPLTNVHEVLQVLETFAAANGWTVNRSCLADAIADVPIPFDDSGQSGDIGAATSPWSSNFEGAYSIAASVLTVANDVGSYYNAEMDVQYAVGDNIEIEFEVLTRQQGTLALQYGLASQNGWVYTTTRVGVQKFVYPVEGDGKIRFISSDFIGTFRLLSIKKRVASIDLCLFKSGVGYFNFATEIANVQDRIANKGPFIYTTSSNAYDAGAAWNAQPGTSPTVQTNSIDDYHGNNIFGYHFFAADKHIYAVIEVRQGEFAHFGFGISRKYFDFRGGNFVYGTHWLWDTYCNSMDWYRHGLPFGYFQYYDTNGYNQYRADLLGTTLDSWLNDNVNGSSGELDRLWGTYYGYTDQEYKENTYYGTSPLVPVYFAGVDINQYKYSLGEMEEYRKIFCQYIDPKTVLSIDGEDWMVFPIKRKQLTTPEEYVPNSLNYALAYYIGPSA